MKKLQPIKVPKGIRYLSDWPNNPLNYIFTRPEGSSEKFILDKKMPGCGLTHWCLTNEYPVILCSPRKILLQNKAEQLGKRVYLVTMEEVEDLGVDEVVDLNKRNFSSKKSGSGENAKISGDTFLRIQRELTDYLNQCWALNEAPKVLITYDSLGVVLSIIQDFNNRGFAPFLKEFTIVVDEFQSMFTDARFKGDVEEELSDILSFFVVRSVLFASATPMMDGYLGLVNIFKDCSYTNLDWVSLDPNRLTSPTIIAIGSQRPIRKVEAEIIKYLKEDFDANTVEYIEDGVYKSETSKELVIYVNAVNKIIELIKKFKNQLTPENTNIICAKTDKNQRRLSKLGPDWKIGRLPLSGEPRKTFTFCTSTVYIGADFYSDNARSIVLADVNIESLLVDISLDLPQIIGRQRRTYYWSNSITLYYKAGSSPEDARKQKAELLKVLEEKRGATSSLLDTFNNNQDPALENFLLKNLIQGRGPNYENSYVTIKVDKNTKKLYAKENAFVIASEIRALEVQCKDYADRFQVFNSVVNHQNTHHGNSSLINFRAIKNLVEKLNKLGTKNNKLQFICIAEEKLSEQELSAFLREISDLKLVSIYRVLGSKKLKDINYNYDIAINELSTRRIVNNLGLGRDPEVVVDEGLNLTPEQRVARAVYSSAVFQVGNTITRSKAKVALQKIYDKKKIPVKAKSTDLSNFFEIKEITPNKNGNRERSFLILKKK